MNRLEEISKQREKAHSKLLSLKSSVYKAVIANPLRVGVAISAQQMM